VAVVDILRIPSLAARAPRRSWLARASAPRDADRWLRMSEGRWESHPAFAWRTAELTSSRERRLLARSLRGIVTDVRALRSTFSASPLNRRGLAPYLHEIEELADRVDPGGSLMDALAGIGSATVDGNTSMPWRQPPCAMSGYPVIQFPATSCDDSELAAHDPRSSVSEALDV
jgi:hypothetical protein